MFAFKTDDNGRIIEFGDNILIPDGIETEDFPGVPEDYIYADGEFIYSPVGSKEEGVKIC